MKPCQLFKLNHKALYDHRRKGHGVTILILATVLQWNIIYAHVARVEVDSVLLHLVW